MYMCYLMGGKAGVVWSSLEEDNSDVVLKNILATIAIVDGEEEILLTYWGRGSVWSTEDIELCRAIVCVV